LNKDIILKTTNGGEDWLIKQNIREDCSNHDVFFIDENVGWVIGHLALFAQNPLLQKTTDGGENWTVLSKLSGTAIQFISSDVGWYINAHWNLEGDGSINKTTNGGQSFIQQLGDTLVDLEDICFIDEYNGWVVGNRGAILHTTNGGEIWNVQMQRSNWILLTSVDFVDYNFGWTVGYEGIIYTTINGGEDWVEQESGVTENLFSVCFVDSNTGWAVGGGGTILKTTTGGTSFVEEEETDEIPTNYSLSQNYPNPFNPNTTINYQIPELSLVMIKVYDVLGNEVKTLVNEEKQTGTYEITWYVEGLPSGVYFYRLQAGDFVETKKMVLMK
jgi:photosystem II stability/assembly factor-like uncharacterized protein